ncbi:MAG: L,D-transpeptidase family protein, partial [Sphingomonadales bacterium]|nr:L,D-transpeptidase family protein [Sphingomonadales bacterium]
MAIAEPPPPIDQVVVHKAQRVIELYAEGQLVRTIEGIQLGGAPAGPKHFQGDKRTPEGRYTIDYGNPDSGYHLSLHISYPNAEDAAYARSRGRSPGGLIFIHGQPNDYPGTRVPGDWTDGCIAV